MAERMRATVVALLAFAAVVLVTDQPLVVVATVGLVAALAVAVAVALLVASSTRHPAGRAVRPRRGLVPAQPEPAHPDTAGRARPRAPGGAIPAV